MRKILYTGDISPALINIFDARYTIVKNEILELDDIQATKVLENINFIEVNGKEVKKEQVKSKETINMDLNYDGIVDNKDVTIAAKILASVKRK